MFLIVFEVFILRNAYVIHTQIENVNMSKILFTLTCCIYILCRVIEISLEKQLYILNP